MERDCRAKTKTGHSAAATNPAVAINSVADTIITTAVDTAIIVEATTTLMATITTAGHRAAIGHVIITKTENRKAISRAITIMPPVAVSAGLTSRAAVTILATTARRKAATSPVEVTNNRNGGAYGNARGGGYRQGGYRSQGHGFDSRNRYNNPKKRIDYIEESVDPNEPIRLNKFLANAGVCSRREADEFIQAGVVTVNGEVVTELGTKITRADEVKFHDQPVKIEKKVYILLNKPKDCMVTSDDPQERKTVMDLVKDACPERIYPVGRLDRNTTGVLLLTNDGELSSKLTHPKFLKKKVYHVHLDKALSLEDMRKIAEGIFLEDGEIKADDIQYVDERDKSQVGIEIHSGKNRIVRRIFESLGYRVTRLDRVLFAGLTKKGLRRGDWRFLTQKEVEMLRMGAFE